MGAYIAGSQPSVLGLSVGQGPRAKLYPFDVLLKEQIVNDFVAPYQVTVVMDPANNQAMAFSRKVDDRVLTFTPLKARDKKARLMRDRETGSIWNRMSGRAIEGPLKGTELLPLISVPWLKERWGQIYESGIVYGGP